MSWQTLLCHNKILVEFSLHPSARREQEEILHCSNYFTMVYHHHYPIVYFEELHQHFLHLLPPGTEPGHLRIYQKEKQLPSDLPIGLFINRPCTLQIQVSPLALPPAPRVLKNSWKKSHEVINPRRHASFVLQTLKADEILQRYRSYRAGRGVMFHLDQPYEGLFMIAKGVVGDCII